ncbi:MAG: GNAT family N-acetyltransferase [Bdellovibrionales bacterium]|nr:GNAT family N-acetyltransferase [Bdellovibrionales bacterium]
MRVVSIKDVSFEAFKGQIFQIFLSQSSYQKHDVDTQWSYFEKWVGIYYKNWPDWFFVAVKDNEILGYICACPNSLAAIDKISFKSYHLFKEVYKDNPVHFHINVKAGITGKGIGAQLLHAITHKASSEGYKNLHIITSSHEKNVNFYHKYGFKTIASKSLGAFDLLLMRLDLGLSLPNKIDKYLQS